MANLKSFHSTAECSMTVLNYRQLFPRLCLSVMNGPNLVLLRKLALHSWDTVNGSESEKLFLWILNIWDFVQNSCVNKVMFIAQLSFVCVYVYVCVWQRFLPGDQKGYSSVCFVGWEDFHSWCRPCVSLTPFMWKHFILWNRDLHLITQTSYYEKAGYCMRITSDN